MKKVFTLIVVVLSLISCSKEEVKIKTEKLNILVIGNSIVKHEPNPSLGWYNNCGMAATSPEKDFCGLLESSLNAEVDRINVTYWEANFAHDLHNFVSPTTKRYDILVIKVGENVDRTDVRYKEEFRKMVNFFKENVNRVVVVSTVWNEYSFDDLGNPFWTPSSRDAAMKEVAQEDAYTYVDLSEMKGNTSFYALNDYENGAVACHPNNIGMKYIADKILEKLN